MTVEEFLVRLEGTPRDWCVEAGMCGSYIRRGPRVGPSQCPITALLGWPAGSFEKAAACLDMPEGLKT